MPTPSLSGVCLSFRLPSPLLSLSLPASVSPLLTLWGCWPFPRRDSLRGLTGPMVRVRDLCSLPSLLPSLWPQLCTEWKTPAAFLFSCRTPWAAASREVSPTRCPSFLPLCRLGGHSPGDPGSAEQICDQCPHENRSVSSQGQVPRAQTKRGWVSLYGSWAVCPGAFPGWDPGAGGDS